MAKNRAEVYCTEAGGIDLSLEKPLTGNLKRIKVQLEALSGIDSVTSVDGIVVSMYATRAYMGSANAQKLAKLAKTVADTLKLEIKGEIQMS